MSAAANPGKRLAFLEKVTGEGSTDALAWYGLALEYAGLGRVDDALRTFERLRELHEGYVPQYLMCGQTLAKAGRTAEARTWFEEGIATARGKGDTHALGEMQDALAALGP